ncbi:FkbM family methyltransferase [Roseococcus sp. DSY-14]|uniref:FkbM family methyltransferase n=1 Tax=Roseococcus sp. DSY-14 TaxID=3369650 RepID=UPI00387AEA1D
MEEAEFHRRLWRPGLALDIGAHDGLLTVPLATLPGARQEQWASLAKDYAGFAGVGAVSHRVPVLPLDTLALDGVTAVKLDAEGHEEAVLRGGAATLRRCRPVLSVEVEERHAPGSTARVPALLAALGYAGFFWLDGLRPLAGFDAATMQAASPDPSDFRASDPYVFTFFFVPEERRDAALAALA